MFVLDARFIDQADNTAVSTWADRSGNGYDVSQATGANQPTLQTQEQGGSSTVRFDGSNDSLSRSDSGFPTGDLTIIGVHKQNNSLAIGSYASVFNYGAGSTGSSVFYLYGSDVNLGTNAIGVSQYGSGVGINNSTGAYIVGSWNRTGTSYAIRRDGGTDSTKTMTTNTSLYGAGGLVVGGLNPGGGSGNRLTGDIGTVMIFASDIATSLRRRFERGCGLTWKIACS